MTRTQISFDKPEYERARKLAERKGLSLAELCRRGLREAVLREQEASPASGKPWMKHAGAFSTGDARSSESVDAVVYGRAEP